MAQSIRGYSAVGTALSAWALSSAWAAVRLSHATTAARWVLPKLSTIDSAAATAAWVSSIIV